MLSEKGPAGNILYYNNAGECAAAALYCVQNLGLWHKHGTQKPCYFKVQLHFSCTAIQPVAQNTTLYINSCNATLLNPSNLSSTISTKQHGLEIIKFILPVPPYIFSGIPAQQSSPRAGPSEERHFSVICSDCTQQDQALVFRGSLDIVRGKEKHQTLTYEKSIWKSGNSNIRLQQHLSTSACPVLRKAQP